MSDRDGDAAADVRLRRCPDWVRWLPRVLGGALLAAALIVIMSLESGPSLLGRSKAVLMVMAGAVALWVVRAGSDVRLEAGLVDDALRIGARGRYLEVPLGDIEALDYAPPFVNARNWPPALVVVDRHDRRFRVPAALRDGPACWVSRTSRARAFAASSNRKTPGWPAPLGD